MPAPSECTHLFVTGCPRSGTTLLQLMVSSHPEISICPETLSLQTLVEQCPVRGELTESQTEHLKHIILSDAKLGAWRIDCDRYLDEVRRYESITLRAAIEHMLKFWRDATRPSAHIIGNKKEFYLKYAELIMEMFPNARFVSIVRDGRAVVSSMIRHIDVLRDNVHRSVLMWRWLVHRGRNLAIRYPASFREVRYETLVENPEATCREICEFIGVPYSAQMLAYHGSDVRARGVLQGHDEKHRFTEQQVTGERTDRWREELTAEQIRVIELLAGRELEMCGYAPSGPRKCSTRERVWLFRVSIEAWVDAQRHERWIRRKMCEQV